MPKTELSSSGKKSLLDQGFMRLPGLIEKPRILAALKEINNRISQGPPKQDDGPPTVSTYWSDNLETPAVMNLFHKTKVRGLAESLIGKRRFQPVTSAQLVLRFPSLARAPKPPDFHIDGMYSGSYAQDKSFTMLALVFLSDVPARDCGGLVVCPGSHRVVENHVRRYGAAKLSSLFHASRWKNAVPVTGRAGDVLICPYQLIHTANDNFSPYIRYAVYFRLTHKDHFKLGLATMSDIWREWTGLY